MLPAIEYKQIMEAQALEIVKLKAALQKLEQENQALRRELEEDALSPSALKVAPPAYEEEKHKEEILTILDGQWKGKRKIYRLKRLMNDQLAVALDNGDIEIWDLVTKRCIDTLQEHGNAVKQIAPLSPTRFASAAYDNTIILWEQTADKRFKAIKTLPVDLHLFYMQALPDGRLVTSHEKGALRIWG